MKKYRIYDKHLQIIRDVKYIDFEGKEENANLQIVRNFDEVNIMESTGLKDKKGKEIYEGDICKSYNGFENEYNQIKWSDKDFTWLIEGDLAVDYLKDFIRNSSLEIVGNIYENQNKKSLNKIEMQKVEKNYDKNKEFKFLKKIAEINGYKLIKSNDYYKFKRKKD